MSSITTASVKDPLVKFFDPVSSVTFVCYIAFLVDFFLRISSRVPGMGHLRPTLLLVLVITALLVSQSKILSKRPKSEISDAIKALLIYLVISLPFVTFPGSVLTVNTQIFLKAIVFFFFTAMCVDNNRRLCIFLIVFVGCQVFRVLEPLYMNITSGYWGSETYAGGGKFASRLAGSPYDVINPNELGFVIATCVPFLHFMLFPRGWMCKVIYAVVMTCLFYALILTMSRGAFLSLLVVGVLVFKASKYKAFLIIAALGIAIAGWSVMTPFQKDRYLSLVSSDTKGSKTVEGRFQGMADEFLLGLHRPVFGHGLGTTAEAKYNLHGFKQASHNLYAELLIEIGAIGMFLFFKFLSRIYKAIKLINTRVAESNDFSKNLYKTILCVYFMYLVYSINYWGLSQSYWYLLAGLAVAYSRLVETGIYKVEKS